MGPKHARDDPNDDVEMGDNRPLRRLRLGRDHPEASSSRPAPPPFAPEALDDQPLLTEREIWDLSVDERKKYRQRVWLSRSRNWDGFPGVWNPVAVLGQGSYGVAGHFQYTGNDLRVQRDIVVKQSGSHTAMSLRKEAAMLKELGAYGSPHIIRLYKDYHEEGGTGVHQFWDPSPWRPTANGGETTQDYNQRLEVSRIYLEYCPKGSADKFFFGLYATGNNLMPADEPHVWILFKCLVTGLLVLKNGSEVPNAPKRGRTIAHLDIKLDNVFCGYPEPTTHQNYPINKLADFGMAQHFYPPEDTGRHNNFVAGALRAGAIGFKAPEQIHEEMYPEIDTRLDLWAAAATIYILIMGRPINDRSIYMVSYGGRTFATYGEEIWNSAYSSTLKGTLYRCLAHRPSERPSLEDLLQTINAAIQVAVSNPDHNRNRSAYFDNLNADPLKINPADGRAWRTFRDRPDIDSNIPLHVMSIGQDNTQTQAGAQNGDTTQGPPRFRISRFRPVPQTPAQRPLTPDPIAAIGNAGINLPTVRAASPNYFPTASPEGTQYAGPATNAAAIALMNIRAAGDPVAPLVLQSSSPDLPPMNSDQDSLMSGQTPPAANQGLSDPMALANSSPQQVSDPMALGTSPQQPQPASDPMVVSSPPLRQTAEQQAHDQMELDQFTQVGLNP